MFIDLCTIFWPCSKVYRSHISQSESIRRGASKAGEQLQLRGRAKGWVTLKKAKREDEKVKVDIPLWQLIYVPIFITCPSPSLSSPPFDRSTWVGFKLNDVCRYAWMRETAWGRGRESDLRLVKSLLKFLLHYTRAFPLNHARVTLRHEAYMYACRQKGHVYLHL